MLVESYQVAFCIMSIIREHNKLLNFELICLHSEETTSFLKVTLKFIELKISKNTLYFIICLKLWILCWKLVKNKDNLKSELKQYSISNIFFTRVRIITKKWSVWVCQEWPEGAKGDFFETNRHFSLMRSKRVLWLQRKRKKREREREREGRLP